jgi:SdpC family antimicrobial peptide
MLLPALLPLSALLTACGGQTSAAPRTSELHGSALGGEELLRGLFFGSGPVAERWPELRIDGARPGEVAPVAAADPILRSIEARSPAFLGWFAAAVQSGDRVRIVLALRAAEALLVSLGAYADLPDQCSHMMDINHQPGGGGDPPLAQRALRLDEVAALVADRLGGPAPAD